MGSAPARSGRPSVAVDVSFVPVSAATSEVETTTAVPRSAALRRKGVAPRGRYASLNRLVCHTYVIGRACAELASLLNSPTSCSSSTTLSFSLARIDNRTPWLVGTQPEHSACSAALSCNRLQGPAAIEMRHAGALYCSSARP